MVGRSLAARADTELRENGGHVVVDPAGCAARAVSVVDAWHGRGVGTSLVRALRDRARTAGIRELVPDVMAENAPMLHVLRRELPAQRTVPGGRDHRSPGPLPRASMVKGAVITLPSASRN